jgi:3-dehydroquinate synthetase
VKVLSKLNLPSEFSVEDTEEVLSACSHDKKLSGKDITAVYVSSVGSFEFRKMPFEEFENNIRQVLCK